MIPCLNETGVPGARVADPLVRAKALKGRDTFTVPDGRKRQVVSTCDNGGPPIGRCQLAGSRALLQRCRVCMRGRAFRPVHDGDREMLEINPICDQLRAAIREYMIGNQIPGMTLALTNRAQTLWTAVFGYADLAAKIPLTADTLFAIGSIGKSFTAIALLQEHEAGNLDIDQPVKRYSVDEHHRAHPGIHVAGHRRDEAWHTSGVAVLLEGSKTVPVPPLPGFSPDHAR